MDHNRALGQLVEKTGVKQQNISGVYIFGNHSLTQYPCLKSIQIDGKPVENVI